MRENIQKIIIMTLFVILAVGFTTAQPLGVEDVDVLNSTRFNDATTPTQVDAQAGNVTQLAINGTAVTRFWQGFYGNITGEILLADSAGNNFYNWSVSTPNGQIYASRSNAVTWVDVMCANATQIGAEETYLGHNSTAPDSVSNTFSDTNHPAISVGQEPLATCPTTQAYDSTGGQGTAFWQILLSDTTNTIYTTVLEDATSGFDGRPWHFQLLVGENGVANSATTPYYFYLELQ